MAFWLRISLIYGAVAAVLLIAFGADWRTGLELLLLAVGVTPEIIRRSPGLYLRWNRLKYSVRNSETTWNLGVRHTGSFSHADVVALVRRIAGAEPRSTRVLSG